MGLLNVFSDYPKMCHSPQGFQPPGFILERILTASGSMGDGGVQTPEWDWVEGETADLDDLDDRTDSRSGRSDRGGIEKGRDVAEDT